MDAHPDELGIVGNPLRAKRQRLKLAFDLLNERLDGHATGPDDVEIASWTVNDPVGDKSRSAGQREAMILTKSANNPPDLGLQRRQHVTLMP